MMKKALFGMGILMVLGILININSAYAAWLDPEWAYRISVDVTNSLSRSRTNVSMEINATNKDHVNADCSDIRMTTDDGVTPFIYFNITNSVDYCTVRWYDNFTSEQTKGYYIYYWNMLASAPTYYQADEKLWGWNGVNVNEFTEIQDEWGSRVISKKDCEGTACIAITESGTGGNAIWNISGLDTNENYLDSLYMRYTTKYNGSDADSYGTPSQIHRVTASADSLYDLFTYSGDAGCGWSGFYMRNKTSGDWKGSIDCVQLAIVKNAWLTQYSYYMIPSYYNYAVLYNSTNSYVNYFQWGSTFDSRSVGFRLYSGDNTDGDIAFIKDFEVGTLLINRNLTTSAGSEESYEESTTTTTTPETTTTTTPQCSYLSCEEQVDGCMCGSFLITHPLYCCGSANQAEVTQDDCFSDCGITTSSTTLMPTTTIDLGNAERISYFCQADSWLVKNRTYWNTSAPAWVTEYNMTNCEYGCKETLLGTRCNFQPSMNILIGFVLLAGLLFLIVTIRKLIRGFT